MEFVSLCPAFEQEDDDPFLIGSLFKTWRNHL